MIEIRDATPAELSRLIHPQRPHCVLRAAIVLVDEGDIISYVLLGDVTYTKPTLRLPELRLLHFSTAPRYRNQGYMRTLMDSVVDRYKYYCLSCYANHMECPEAISVLLGAGFRPTEPGYYCTNDTPYKVVQCVECFGTSGGELLFNRIEKVEAGEHVEAALSHLS